LKKLSNALTCYHPRLKKFFIGNENLEMKLKTTKLDWAGHELRTQQDLILTGLFFELIKTSKKKDILLKQ